MKIKLALIIFLSFIFLAPTILFAQANSEQNNEAMFEARVLEVVEQTSTPRSDGSVSIRQKLRVKGLEGDFLGKEMIFDGTEFDILSASEYKAGDKVIVNYSAGPEGTENFYVIGFARTNAVYFLALLFAIAVIIIGKTKGLRALAVLILSFLIILKYIIPSILSGGDPLMVGIIGSFFILILAIYITEGFKRTSTIAIFSISVSLIITGLLSVWFSAITKLTGFASEEVAYLVGLTGASLNVKGLLLAGIIIGTLGVLDDIVISQVALVKELKAANPDLSKRQAYKQAMRVGISHLSSMVNTLFLAYAGASLPLLILFSVKQEPFLTFHQVINNEMIATEIVRTLAGSIGLVLAVPIATFLAVQFIKQEINK